MGKRERGGVGWGDGENRQVDLGGLAVKCRKRDVDTNVYDVHVFMFGMSKGNL